MLNEYRKHAYSIREEISRLSFQWDEIQRGIEEDPELVELESQLIRFREEAIRLNEECIEMKEDLKSLPGQLSEGEDRKVYLEEELKTVRRRNWGLENQIDALNESVMNKAVEVKQAKNGGPENQTISRLKGKLRELGLKLTEVRRRAFAIQTKNAERIRIETSFRAFLDSCVKDKVVVESDIPTIIALLCSEP